MPAPQEILNLIERFEQNRESYMSGDYKEARLRTEFIDPFFKTLGWDMNNEQGYAEAYKDVIIEDSLKIGQATKAPDYCFRIGGARKFFNETKKPSVNIKEAIQPAFQLRRYGWSSKVLLSILTDFEEFAVYDCRIKPDKNDSAAIARIMYLNYNDYPKKWDEIKSIFSRESILKGSFDKFAEGIKGKKGTASVDDSFLSEIENWRELLAKNIAIRNSQLTTRELNFAVQKTIDRIIFLRICEDRGIELYGKLQSLINGERIYERVVEYFRTADARYNSGLFHFQSEKNIVEEPDYLTQRISIDDKILKQIVGSLYYPECPFEFSVLPADILGQVYERFLGKVIRLTEGHQAKVEEKPEVRKAGGVYYTPTYIEDYIVDNTVCKLLEGRKLDAKAPLRVADISCGSGSFLIVAYQKLLDWYLIKYTEENPEKYAKGKNPRIRRGRNGEWKLTINERKRILLEHIYGVDIDSQAVEVTKLSLLLKVLEGENEEIFQGMLFQERALPDLGSNIKCGNSLIGSDFYANRQADLFNEDEMIRVNAFDWESQFSEVFKDGGFDAIIGNPPYGAFFTEGEIEYLKNKYSNFVLRGESYLVFVEKAICLTKFGGKFGYIIPDTYLNLGFTQSLRTFLLQNTKINEIISLPSNVFSGATVDTTLFFCDKYTKTDEFNFSKVLIKTFGKKNRIDSITNPLRTFFVTTENFFRHKSFNVNSNAQETDIICKIDEKFSKMGDFADMFSGIKAYEVGKGNPPQTDEIRDSKPFTSKDKKNSDFQPLYDGKHIGRYISLWDNDNWINYGTWLAAPRDPDNFVGEKILIRKIIDSTLIGMYISQSCYCNTLLFVLKVKPEVKIKYMYLLGILNSRFIGWYFRKKVQISKDDTFPQIMIRDILQFSIPLPPDNEKLSFSVTKMLDLNKKLTEAKVPDTKTMLQRQIESTDKEIDRLVYELYGLTADEINIVEGEK